MEFLEEEYDPYLGLYQKWLHGDKKESLEKVFSFSAFQYWDKKSGYIKMADYQKYAEYLYLSITSIIDNTKEYYIRLYIDESLLSDKNPDKLVWEEKLKKFMEYSRVQIICIRFPRYYNEEYSCHEGLLAVMFRYLALFDPNVSVILFRDIDNVWTNQHHYFTEKWLERGDELCLFLNEDYKRQQVSDLTPDDVILEDVYYTTLLSGLWNIKKPIGEAFSPLMWQKIFAYIENYTSFVFKEEYKDYKFYGVRFSYGFDELALSRIVIPIFLNMGMNVYAIPIKIYDPDYFNNMFDDKSIQKFLSNLSDKDTLDTIQKITVNNYWHMFSCNAGLSQYILCILTNIYFELITKKNKFYKNEYLINNIKNKIYPNPLLMSIGLFTFKNYQRYNWYPIKDIKTSGGIDILRKFTDKNQKITLEEWTAGSDLSNDGNGENPCPGYNI